MTVGQTIRRRRLELAAILQDFKSAGTISKEEAKALIDADDCDADFGIHQFERAGR